MLVINLSKLPHVQNGLIVDSIVFKVRNKRMSFFKNKIKKILRENASEHMIVIRSNSDRVVFFF